MTPAQRRQLDPLMQRARTEGWASWVRDVQDEHAVLAGCTFHLAAAERVREFFRRFLRLANPRASEPDQPRTIPFELLDWQWLRVVAPLFGWKRADGLRRFRYAWVEVGKKNGKSPLVAAIILALLVIDGEQDPEIYSAATTKEQAGIIFKEVQKMISRSPALQKVLDVKAQTKRVVFARAHGFYQVLASKPASVDGIQAHGLAIDEIHRLAKRDLYDALQYSTAARRQPVEVIITTAGDDRQSIGYELHDRATKIAQGSIIDSQTLVYIAAAEPDDDPGDPATWRKANPSLGITIQAADLAAEYQRCRNSPARMTNFKRLRLNMWVTRVSRWLDFDRWAACPARAPVEELLGRPCYGGLDLSSKYDITAFVLQFPRELDGVLYHDVLSWFWLPEENIAQQEELAGVPYRAWAEQGLIELTPGDYIDYAFVRRRILELVESYQIQEIAFDPAFAQQIGLELMEAGLRCFEFWQRPTMTNPVLRYTESAVIESRLRHGDNPILNWMAGNVEVVQNADGLIKPVKPKNAQKIDGIAALAMSMGTHCKQAEDAEPYYDENPLI